MHRWLRHLRQKLSGPRRLSPQPFITHTQSWKTIERIVAVFYAGVVFFVCWHLHAWKNILERRTDEWLWPLLWINAERRTVSIHSIMSLYLLGPLLAAFFPKLRWVRILAFLGIFLGTALLNSGGRIGHSSHALVLCAFVLVFLPDHPVNRAGRHHGILVFWAATAIFLLTYTMSGIGKICGGLWQIALGERSSFHPEALALHIADRLLQTHSTSLLGDWIIQFPLIGWPLMLATIYFQSLALVFAFRPEWLRFLAFVLIAFHLASYFTMTIIFAPSVFLLLIFLAHSPFAPPATPWRTRLQTLPLVGPWITSSLEKLTLLAVRLASSRH